MEQKELKQGNKYLVKRTGTLSLIEVLLITQTAYQFRYESGNTGWIEKEEFNTWYWVIENVSEYEIGTTIKEKENKQEFETCPICHGMGTVPDPSQTAGTKPCPLCSGNKMILKKIQTIS